jgi:hypothetical protein
MKCIGLTLPEGMEFMPPKVDTTKSPMASQLEKIAPPKARAEEDHGS